jgi:hypothetical protein
MYLVPVVVQAWDSSLLSLWLLLERNGSHLIEVASEGDAKTFLVENGLSKEPTLVEALPGVLFAPVSPREVDLAAFYSWREVAPGTIPAKEVWRNFLWTRQDEVLGVNIHLNELQVSPNHSIYQILKAYAEKAS